eukprot:NODE_1228_length_1019_cov_350.536082_g942_i0.p1 GENE.NODE_1228_length_1019_cov_350.536082_g942_i0~~NODE_1228_length_1019_cov_350.536082_g942_i0.p1  ORF type:complete len:266 (+),score=64.39 NODE_1228_length_1019_cov_350.536082_g942_i0:121-918(+)
MADKQARKAELKARLQREGVERDADRVAKAQTENWANAAPSTTPALVPTIEHPKEEEEEEEEEETLSHHLMSQILPNLFLGTRQGACHLQTLVEQGITHILNVTIDAPNAFETIMEYKQIPMMDDNKQSLLEFFPAAHAFIDDAHANKKKVLVHCHQGLSRSPSFVIAHLMYSKNWTLARALTFVKERRPKVLPNWNFFTQLSEYEKQLLGPSVVGTYQPSLPEGDYFCHFFVTKGWPEKKVQEALDEAEGDVDKATHLLCYTGV